MQHHVVRTHVRAVQPRHWPDEAHHERIRRR
jgi:hypothetical protein